MALVSTFPLTEKNIRNIFRGVKPADAYALLPCHLNLLIFYKFWYPQPPEALTACIRISN